MTPVDPFHRDLHAALTQRLEEAALDLSLGSARSYEDYRAKVSYSQAIRDVLGICETLERQRYGEQRRDGE